MNDFSRTHILSSSFDLTPVPSLYDWAIERKLGVIYTDDGKNPPLNTVKIKRPTLKLEFQGKFVAAAIRYNHDQKPVRGKRGQVTTFSRASRTRLFDLFHRLDVKNKPIFVTLTYGEGFPSAKTAKNHLRAFFERVRRQTRNDCVSAIWRLEFQERGAPHFHIIFFGLPYIPKETIQKWWGEISDIQNPFTRIEMVRSERGLMFYVSKYVAKVEPAEKSGFISLTYLHAYTYVYGDNIGRVWGVFQRQHLPFAHRITIERDLIDWRFDQFRRIAAGQYPPIANYQTPGFRLYVDDARQWHGIAKYLFDRPPKTKLLARLTRDNFPTTL